VLRQLLVVTMAVALGLSASMALASAAASSPDALFARARFVLSRRITRTGAISPRYYAPAPYAVRLCSALRCRA